MRLTRANVVIGLLSRTRPSLICRINKDGTHIFVNDAYCRYFGKTRAEILGTKFIPAMSSGKKKKVRKPPFLAFAHPSYREYDKPGGDPWPGNAVAEVE